MDSTPNKPLRIAMDARYVREKPSGIGANVRALIDRLPASAPNDRFLFLARPLAAHPLSTATNTREVILRHGANSPLPIYWPARYASFQEVDLFHNPGNLMPPGLPCRSVATAQDVMAVERPDLFPVGDVEELASALRDSVGSPNLRQSVSEQGLSRARDFSWDKNARKTLQIYRDAATAGRT